MKKVAKNSKMPMNTFKILLRRQVKCPMETWKKRKSMVKKKRRWMSDHEN